MGIEERFEGKVYRTEHCHIWTGSKNPAGYGNVYYQGKTYLAHRVAILMLGCDIPSGMYVCHTCDEPSCVNPDHLFLASAYENSQDASRKGRLKGRYVVRGEGHGNAKLTRKQVDEIRALRYHIPYHEVAKRFGISRGTVEKIMRRETWR